jgi:hypothetical protein
LTSVFVVTVVEQQNVRLLLEGLRDASNQSGESVLPGLFGFSVEGTAQFFGEDFLKNGPEFL